MPMLDHTHDATATSWVASANGHPDFPIQNLPLCAFSRPGEAARGGVAIGDQILDLAAPGLLPPELALAGQAPLNDFFALGAAPRRALRHLVFDLWAQIEHLSAAMTLEVGDLIFSGTPGGVGAAMKPPQFLKAGDVVRCEIERLGAIEATLRDEDAR